MKADGPRVITAAGGKYSIKDNRETPDTLQVTYEFPDFVCTYEIRDVSYYAYTAKHHCNVAPRRRFPSPEMIELLIRLRRFRIKFCGDLFGEHADEFPNNVRG